MKRMRKSKLSRRFMALLLCLCMIASMASGLGGMTARAADRGRVGYTESIVKGTRVADPSTMDDYIKRLLSDDNGARYAGRVWTDKSVFAYNADNKAANVVTLDMDTDGYDGTVGYKADFLHVFSSLASSQVVNEYPPSPIDMVLVLDVSSSMGDETDPAAGSDWAKIYDELKAYFEKQNLEENADFKKFYQDNCYQKIEVTYTYNQAGIGEPEKYKINTKTFNQSNFEDNDLITSEKISTSGKIYDQETVDAILEKYAVHKHLNEPDGNRLAITPDVPDKESSGDYREIIDIQVSEGSKYWPINGKKLSMAEVAAKLALKHTRFLNLIYSADRIITELMENNEENRVSVVVYDRRASVLMPLAHYTPNNETLTDEGYVGENQVITYSIFEVKEDNEAIKIIYEFLKGKTFNYLWPRFDAHSANAANGYPNGYVSTSSCFVVATPKEGEEVKTWHLATDEGEKSIVRLSGTNTHAGLTAGLEQLANATDTTLTAELSNGQMSTVPRIPAAIIMTDGGSNTVANGPWYDPQAEVPVQRSDHKNEWSSVVVTQYLLTAAYLKSAVEKNYSNYMDLGEGQSFPIYTVGVDLRTDSDDWVPARLYPMMDPARYLTDEKDVPNYVDNPSADSGKIPLAADGMDRENKTSNAGIIGVAYQNIQTWLASADGQPSTLFPVVQLDGGKYKGMFQQEEGKATEHPPYSYNHYVIPFEENVDDAQNGTFHIWDHHGTDDWYENIQEFSVKYALPWHGWTVLGTDTMGEVGGKGTQVKMPANSVAPALSAYDIEGTATFWSFNEAKNSSGKSHTVAEPNYEAEYLEVRNVDYDDTDNGLDDAKTRVVRPVTQEDMKSNINYVKKFYDVSSAEMEGIFEAILTEVLGQVFVPVSGSNDAGVGDSITYQDPIGQYMEIKNGSVKATPFHNGEATGTATDFDMALLLFGEMHGLNCAGVYDYHWNNTWMEKHKGQKDPSDPEEKGIIEPNTYPFPQGWYFGDAETAEWSGNGKVPTGPNVTKVYATATEARNDGWIFRLNFKTATQFVPILSSVPSPSEIPPQMKNTVYTIYQFALTGGDEDEADQAKRNPVYGDVPAEVLAQWEDASIEQRDALKKEYPGLYQLNDIRVWSENTGDFVDTDGAITPNTGYDLSLYVNIPAAAVPTELVTITLGEKGVLSYETNLGSDHGVGTKYVDDEGVTQKITSEDDPVYKNYCAQSTPLRLFYAVGLEESLILRDAEGKGTGIDFNAISPEYLSTHTELNEEAKTDYVWFISNFYSGTRYDDYATDGTARTRGDPTVTFSPGADNRYYVFQKPLPLYAHAYRSTGGGNLTPVDKLDGTWEAEGGNGSTTWEDGQKGGASWGGGQYMGMYESQEAFKDAWNDKKDGKITDSNGITYTYVENGIVFLKNDVLNHVTSKPGSEEYENGSTSFSSDDYFFILLEYYMPDEGVGKDNDDKNVPGTTGGHVVQYALARKGSEFGSGFASEDINNGDMLCWTEMGGKFDNFFPYMSKTDTGDLTRGEPTFEKLTYKADGEGEENLRTYLLNTCGIDPKKTMPDTYYDVDEDTTVLEYLVDYWSGLQKDPVIQAVLDQADTEKGDGLTRDEFNAAFRFAVAARPGGIRSGDMSNNRQRKSENKTKTSSSYYMPTISDHSGTDNNVIINNYLGNNGRLEIANQMLHVTKTIEPPAGATLTEAQKNEAFNYQIYVEGVTGTHSAARTTYNEYSGKWERRLAYIDVLTDNSSLVQTTNNTRALFVLDESSGTPVAKQVVTDAEGVLHYANDDGTMGTTQVTGGPQLYYLYLPSNGTGAETQIHRLYQDPEYDGDDAKNFATISENNGVTTYVSEDHRDLTGGTDYSIADDTKGRPLGTKTYWSKDAELIPVNEVDNVPISVADGVSSGWKHSSELCESEHKQLDYHTFVIHKPGEETSEPDFISPFTTRSQYLTVELNFGENANVNDGSNKTGTLTADDLYDKTIPKKLSDSGVRNNEDIAKNTAEFTLRHGEGLFLTGLRDGVAYRFTEKLTEAQKDKGYTLKEVNHAEDEGEIDNNFTYNAEYFGDTGGVYSVHGHTNSFEQQARYVNTFEVGDISITKELAAAPGATITADDRNTKFDFTLKLEQSNPDSIPLPDTLNYTIGESKGTLPKSGVTDDNGVYAVSDDTWAFQLKAGQKMTVVGLPADTGYTYTVSEETYSLGYDTTVKVDDENVVDTRTASGEIEPGEAKSVLVTFTNTKKPHNPGSLTVSKTVTGDGDKNKEWHFTVTLSDTTVTGDYGEMYFTNGVASFTLKHGESKTATGLPAGVTYTVAETEANADGYTTSANGDTGTIVEDATASAAFTNDKPTTPPPEEHFGSLTVSKTVTGEGGDTSKDWHFTVTLSDTSVNGNYGAMSFTNGVANFTLKHSESKTATNLPAGVTYTVAETEANTDGYTTSATGEEGTIPEDDTASAAFTNDKPTTPPPPPPEEPVGNLRVSKTVTGEGGDTSKEWNFTVTLSDTNITGDYGDMSFTNGVASFTLKHGESKTATNLPAGVTYTVTETEANADGYTTSSTGETGTIPENDTASAAFTNDKPTTPPPPPPEEHFGNLTVSKTVTGEGGDTSKEWHFTVTLSDTTVTGDYGEMHFTNGVANFTLKHGESKSATGLPAGVTYTITETEANMDGYTTSSTGETGSIPEDGTANAAFTNDKPTTPPPPPPEEHFGSLTISKTVTGDGDTSKEWHFTVTLSESITGDYGEMTFANGVASFTLKHGESKTATGLPAGVTYTVTETEANTDGYTTSSTGDTGTIIEDATASAVFTNDKPTTPPPPPPEEHFGNLTVSKTVTGESDTNKEWHFTVTLSESITGDYGEMSFTDSVANFTLKHGESITATGLPAGVTYTVTETEANTDGYTTEATGATGTIPENGTASAAFTNDKPTTPPPPPPEEPTGSLTVSKTVTGLLAETERDFTFTVTLNDTSINGEYGDMHFTDGVATFTLKHGESKTATNLPAGVSYTVTETEANRDGYTTSATGNTGAILENGTANAEFVNDKPFVPPPEEEEKEEKTGGLTVTKTVTGEGGETDRAFHFTVMVSDPNVSGDYGGMSFIGGVANFTLRHGESRSAAGLPADVSYSVSEEPVEGYTTSATGASGTIPENGMAMAGFVNHKEEKEPGSLRVTKTVRGSLGETEREFTFTVTLGDPEINGEYGEMHFTNGVATFTLRHNESKTATGLPADVLYSVSETEANEDDYATSAIGDTGTIPEGGEARAEFINSRGDVPEEADRLGMLVVRKVVTGTNGDPNREFNFTVTLSDPSINGTYGFMVFTDGVANFTLRSGENMWALYLPYGVGYTVTEAEANSDGYYTVISGDTGTIPVQHWAEARFQNHGEGEPPEEEYPWLEIPEDEVPLAAPPRFYEVPQTGDESNAGMYALLMFLSLMGMAVMAFPTNKSRKFISRNGSHERKK